MSARARHGWVLRAYPRAWRDRYGDELTALIEDSHPTGRLPVGVAIAVTAAGVRERIRQDATGEEAARSGGRLIAWGWSLIVLAGIAVAKVSEHWQAAVPLTERRVPALGIAVASACALVVAVLAAVAVAVAAPALIRFVADGGLTHVRRILITAVAASAAVTVVTVVAIATSHVPESAGGVGVAGILWASLVVAATLALTALATATERHLTLSVRVREAHRTLARAAGVAALGAVIGLVVWFVAVWHDAPRYFSGSGSGLFDEPWRFTMVPVIFSLVVGVGCVVGGERRLARTEA